jgi:hypothetical protein
MILPRGLRGRSRAWRASSRDGQLPASLNPTSRRFIAKPVDSAIGYVRQIASALERTLAR